MRSFRKQVDLFPLPMEDRGSPETRRKTGLSRIHFWKEYDWTAGVIGCFSRAPPLMYWTESDESVIQKRKSSSSKAFTFVGASLLPRVGDVIHSATCIASIFTLGLVILNLCLPTTSALCMTGAPMVWNSHLYIELF